MGPGRRAARGFTLLEVLVAVTITLILMGLVVEVFSRISQGVNNSRANMELNDQLRTAKHRLIQDLRGVTAPMTPPLDPFMNLGYFEYVEGPRVASSQIWTNTNTPSSGGDLGLDIGPSATNSNIRAVNTVIGDTDDMMMFTMSSFDAEPFVGRGGERPNSTSIGVGIQSRYAEVAWFLRRTQFYTSMRADGHAEFFNLHRRTWLISPDGSPFGQRSYDKVDISMGPSGGNYAPTAMPPNTAIDPRGVRKSNPTTTFNTLGDLTRRECRSLHHTYKWPYEMMYVIGVVNGGNVFWNTTVRKWDRFHYLSLPTMEEQSNGNFPMPMEKTSGTGPSAIFVPKSGVTPGGGPTDIAFPQAITTAPGGHVQMAPGARIGEDIILTNVTSFDIKAWDPGAPVFAAPAADTSAPPVAATLIPGDPGYIPAIDAFIGAANSPALQPIGFGAYADLNYMGIESADYLKRWRGYGADGSLGALQKMGNNAPFTGSTRLPLPAFAHPGEGPLSGEPAFVTGASITSFTAARPCVYDTWSTHYEFDGMDNDGDTYIDELTNGVDDNNNGLIDEPNAYNDNASGTSSGEQDAPPPYRAPLRGIKVTIRVMEVDSKQVREVTVVQEFIPL